MRLLVVGLGSIGTRHAKNLMALGHEVHGLDENYSAYSAVPGINIGKVPTTSFDGCLICSPTEFHSGHFEWAAEHDWHIFVEKPIALVQDNFLEHGLELARKRSLVVMVGNMLRFHPNVMMAKLLIKNPKSAMFQVLQKNDKPAYHRDGVLLNWGAHEIDLALYLLGPAKVVGAEVMQEDAATVTLEHNSGATSLVVMDYLTEPEKRGFEIEDEDGLTHEINLTLHDWNPIYIAEMKAFIGLIEGKPDPRCATGEDGLAVLRLIEQAKERARLR